MTMSVAKLVAALTRLDDRVLDAVQRCAPAPTDLVVRTLYPVSTRSRGATAEQAREVLEILHGLERAECVHEVDGVWHVGPSSALAKAKSRR
jgi:hypothetical protein